jgi:hypothetical protein
MLISSKKWDLEVLEFIKFGNSEKKQKVNYLLLYEVTILGCLLVILLFEKN